MNLQEDDFDEYLRRMASYTRTLVPFSISVSFFNVTLLHPVNNDLCTYLFRSSSRKKNTMAFLKLTELGSLQPLWMKGEWAEVWTLVLKAVLVTSYLRGELLSRMTPMVTQVHTYLSNSVRKVHDTDFLGSPHAGRSSLSTQKCETPSSDGVRQKI